MRRAHHLHIALRLVLGELFPADAAFALGDAAAAAVSCPRHVWLGPPDVFFGRRCRCRRCGVALAPLMPCFGQHSLILLVRREHQVARRREGWHGSPLRGHATKAAPLARTALNTWRGGGKQRVIQCVQKIGSRLRSATLWKACPTKKRTLLALCG